MSALSLKKRPRILRSGESAAECGGRSFDVPFIYPFSKKNRESQTGWQGAPEAERKEKDGG